MGAFSSGETFWWLPLDDDPAEWFVARERRRTGRAGTSIRVYTDRGPWHVRRVISATGTWWRPYLPYSPGRDLYLGRQLHTVSYRGSEPFHGRRGVIVGGSNSARRAFGTPGTVA
ncbi:hypothetical protein GCM10023085_24620 [Actinomadura viridis]|uniref:Cation diffusion facilitator CzcD-associated flavoprotein CzcO n=1 Tax=Actinomadura viridis TaxID=58110 RepID=A0A931DGH3_9ACTN|nr:NAD(P)-binding domain-containing protein [Actinomadura viridis]MBG6088837.1 cation diffusion facilitator CzcD-associated flavoprotein CzcO [Actinomadura viridis]